MRLIKQLLSFLNRREKYTAVGLVALMVVAAVWEAASLAAIMPFISLLNDPSVVHRYAITERAYVAAGSPSDRAMLIGAGVFLLVMIGSKNLYLALLYRTQFRFLYARQNVLSRRLLEGYLRSPYLYHLSRNSAELLRIVNSDVLAVCHNLAVPLMLLVTESMVVTIIVAILLLVDFYSTVTVVMLVGALSWLFFASVRKALARRGKLQQYHEGQMIKWVNQGLGSIKETKAAGREAFFVSAYATNVAGYSDALRFLQTVQQLPRLFIETVAMTSMLIVVVLALVQGRDVREILPAVALFATAGYRLMPSMGRMVGMLTMIKYFRATVQIVYDDLRAVESLSPPFIERTSDSGRLSSCDIEIDSLSYRYPEAREDALRHVSLTISAGTSVAFVGPSGAGKTTLVDLILGLLEPVSGSIRVNGRDIRESVRGWQRNIGYVPQAIYLCDDTVRRNVAFGLADDAIVDEKVWVALETAQLAGLIRSLPAGLDTFVGERGVRISGGERQRVGIARAMYHNPAVLIFDEATSALDYDIEREIIQSIDRLKGERTVITVAHRLTAVRYCDAIYVLRDGRLVGQRQFQELATAVGAEPWVMGRPG